MNQHKQHQQDTQRTKTGLAIIVTVAVLVAATSAIQLWYIEKIIRQEVEHRAQSELKSKRLEIENVTDAVKVAVRNVAWAVEANLACPDSLPAIARHLVEQNGQITGTSITFVADYYPQYGRWCEFYVNRNSDGSYRMEQIGGPKHDYLNSGWFQAGIASKDGSWSEPYYDDAGALTMLCSYAVPIHDRSGQTVGLVAADVSLDWLSETINAHHIYPSSYNLLLSRQGQFIAHPEERLIMHQSAEQAAGMEDTTVSHVYRQMTAGQGGQAKVTDNEGEKKYVFYAPVDGDTGWSMAVVCLNREIFHGLRQMTFNLILLMLVGLALLGYIIWRSAKNARHLEEVNAEKERIGTELHIAGEIQNGMIPKTFPPYPERSDVDLFATLVPAREVGGDLYDYFIRDERLFFCIGDVSGKGVPSSLLMAVTRSLFRTLSANEDSPERIVTQMNNAMAEMNENNMFVTLFLGVLNLATGELSYCNAGHCPPVLMENGQPKMINCQPNLAVGMVEGWAFRGEAIVIRPQNAIFLYTDGLTEAENMMHGQFGKQRMLKELQGMSSSDAAKAGFPRHIINRMTEAVHAYTGEAEQSDDLTMLAIQYNKKEA